MRGRSKLIAVLFFVSMACGDPPAPNDAGGPEADAAVAPLSDDYCDRLRGGPDRTTTPVSVALADAHAQVRFFGIEGSYETVDVALAAALRPVSALETGNVEAYADALPGVCAVDADAAPLPAASVRVDGEIAFVTPGTGEVAVPDSARIIALDLRELAAHPELPAALERAVAPLLTGSVPRSFERVRQHAGMVDEVFGPAIGAANVYTTEIVERRGAPIEGTAASARPLVLLTGPRLAPAAAELAGTLRLARRAWIAGQDVFAGVAESRWEAVGTTGIAYRARDLLHEGERWPDRIPADAVASDPETAVAELASRGEPTAIAAEAERPALAALDPVADLERESRLDLGVARAALLIAHGALRLFFPFFDIVGDRIDARLEEVLSLLDETSASDRVAVRHAIQRLSNAIDDAHSYVADWGAGSEYVGALPITIDAPRGTPFVMESAIEALHPGEELLRIDGAPALDRYEELVSFVSAATEGNRRLQAWSKLQYLAGPIELTVRGLDGTERDETIEPQPFSTLNGLRFYISPRASGWLSDLGSDDVYYINVDGSQSPRGEMVRDAVLAAHDARAIVVDMRGYPGGEGDVYARLDALAALAGGLASSAQFSTPVWTGPDQLDSQPDHYDWSAPEALVPTGAVTLLVSPYTQSSAEDACIYLLSGTREITVVGRQSSGTNGNITGLVLPGAFSFTFTGLGVRFPDGSRFHGVGIVPDVEVLPEPEDYASGRDRTLERALSLANGEP